APWNVLWHRDGRRAILVNCILPPNGSTPSDPADDTGYLVEFDATRGTLEPIVRMVELPEGGASSDARYISAVRWDRADKTILVTVDGAKRPKTEMAYTF